MEIFSDMNGFQPPFQILEVADADVINEKVDNLAGGLLICCV